ncbi:DctP family TRAP transporter solute-binding subunit [Microbacterium aerolatum]|uniref:ABC transporter substrate-binding protein n=1 Tax=Microbacterium aerolatum TaxID=153731 RepID=A0A511AKN1_9MICO|nr:DctP family TRAP transporter solute-binding subunit [Microbacterium aerolatum]GEK87391.1 ABC transporter substrate-binding protein [Microbacterium aerolatum]GGB33170.1 ABC transporter substrate-binding protein [Microbacterium aerolatum]
MNARRTRRTMWLALVAAPAMLLVACSSGGDGTGGEAGGDGETRTLALAHSYNEDQPQHRCGAQVIADEVNAAGVGLEVEIFPSSQLGGDADRIASVASGDIDIDIQGASALGAVYEPISVLDSAYAFDDADHLARFMASDASDTVTEAFEEASGVHTLGAWSAGARQFTANTPIRTPEDLEGLRMRFPGSPQFLMNAKALGAEATEVAYEELYLALQQGTVDGQENPITNIVASNLKEVQDYVSMSSHQLNTNLVIVGPVWNDLSEEQQQALTDATEKAVTEVTSCVAEDEETILEEWRTGGEWEVVEDVDRDAFSEKAEEYLSGALTGDSLTVYEAIRSTSE